MGSPVLVTGANGFVGRAVVNRLLRDGESVRGAVRRRLADLPNGAADVLVGDLDGSTDWRSAVEGAYAVVHCAARVHLLNDPEANPLAAFRLANCEGTVNLARQAASAGVRRFVFLSSIKVNGESTRAGLPFRAEDPPAPLDPYGISKNEAEIALRRISSETGMEVVVIRPPLVYGPGVKANFRSMLEWIHRGIPLPLGAITNRRSFVAIDNLIDLIATTLFHPNASGRTFLVSDGEDLSTTDLLRRVACALGRPARLLSVPSAWILTATALAGRPELGQRLCGSLHVDIGPTYAALGWEPPVSVDDALVRTAQQFMAGPT